MRLRSFNCKKKQAKELNHKGRNQSAGSAGTRPTETGRSNLLRFVVEGQRDDGALGVAEDAARVAQVGHGQTTSRRVQHGHQRRATWRVQRPGQSLSSLFDPLDGVSFHVATGLRSNLTSVQV